MILQKEQTAVLIIALCASFPALAAEWSFQPAVSLRTGYNDNIRLTTSDHDAVWETALSPSVKFGVEKRNQGLTGEAGMAIRRYYGGSGQESGDELDREDFSISTDAFHYTLRDRFKANLGYTILNTQDSEIDQTGTVIEERSTRKRLVIGPSWGRTLNQLTNMELGYQFIDVSHNDDPGNFTLVDFYNHNISASLIRNLTPRIQATLAAGLSSYRPDTEFNSETLSLQAGLTRSFSETLVASFLAGRRETTSDTFINTGFCIGGVPGASYPTCNGGIPVPILSKGEIETSGLVFTATITQALEAGSLSATASRTTSPTSSGELLDTTHLGISGSHNFTETLRTSLSVGYTESETIVNRIGFTPNQDNKAYFRFAPKVTWRWQREWEIAGEYRYARSDNPGSAAASHSFYLTLDYLGLKRFVAR